jgi:pimeloyl-ACP methyl ester carboxylesterase
MRSFYRQTVVVTSHGSLMVEESGQSGLPVILIHGNSSSRAVFKHQMQASLATRYRLIAFDLPGHGESSDAPDPNRSYSLPGMADATIELLKKLDLSEVVVLGWSLGGHIGIEMLPRFPGMRGLMITGTPPVAPGNMARGFIGALGAGVAGRQDLSEDDIDAFAKGMFGEPVPPFLREAIARADGRFRKRLFEAQRAGAGTDQRRVVESSLVPLAVVNGGKDPIVNLDYIDSVAYANLWRGHCSRLSGAGHASFWHDANQFNFVLESFLRDVDTPKTSGLSEPTVSERSEN